MNAIKKSTVTSLLFLKYVLLFTMPQADQTELFLESPEYALHLKDNSTVLVNSNFIHHFKTLTAMIKIHEAGFIFDVTDSELTLPTFTQLNNLVSHSSDQWIHLLKEISDSYTIKGIVNLYKAAASLQLEDSLLKIISDFLVTSRA